jgi:Cu+-exporting ATPase
MRRLTAISLGLITAVAVLRCEKQSSDSDSGGSSSMRSEAPRLTVRVENEPAKVERGRPTRFLINILQQPGDRPVRFSEDASDPVHLVIVRNDLGTFAHLHPHIQNDGRFVAEAVLPTDGTYWMFTYFQAAGAEPTSVRSELRVGTRSTLPRPLALTPRDRRVGRYDVTLMTDPDPPSSHEWTSIKFHVMRSGEPVREVEPAGGHLVILPENGVPFVFAHSTLGEATGGMRAILHAPAVPDAVGEEHYVRPQLGPDVQFHTRFPAQGRYKIWGEFTIGRDRIVVDFVVKVI